jgi:16S rRNA G527 N7-methylase RsmG
MPSVEQHYADVLSEVYSWMFGGFEAGVAKNVEFFEQHHITPRGSATAIDLGAGCGFQSIPLARRGFSVTAVDLDRKLLDELIAHIGANAVSTVQDDLLNFDRYTEGRVELVVCMTDTVAHLRSKDEVQTLFKKVLAALEDRGRLILTFRDLSHELVELDRFLPVRSDDNTIFTCFLEYEPETVKVHDLVYRREGRQWRLYKSFYRKLRLSHEWVSDKLSAAGFHEMETSVDHGFVTVIASK